MERKQIRRIYDTDDTRILREVERRMYKKMRASSIVGNVGKPSASTSNGGISLSEGTNITIVTSDGNSYEINLDIDEAVDFDLNQATNFIIEIVTSLPTEATGEDFTGRIVFLEGTGENQLYYYDGTDWQTFCCDYSLDDLTDVVISGPSHDYVLMYDVNTQMWVNAPFYLDNCADVEAPAPNDADVLTWDEDYGGPGIGAWVPAASAGSDSFKVKVSADDTTEDFLETKIGANNGIDIVISPGNEVLGIGVDESELDHGALGGLGDDDHPKHPNVDGRAGGQTIIGGTGANDDLILQATSHATKGDVYIQDGGSGYNVKVAPTGEVVIRDASNNVCIDLATAASSYTAFNADKKDLDFRISGDNETNLFYVDASTDKVGICTITPTEKLDVEGAIALDEMSVLPSYTADRGKIFVDSSDRRLYFFDGANNRIEVLPIYKQTFHIAEEAASMNCNIPYEVAAGQGASMYMASYANRNTFDGTKGLTSSYGHWEWTIMTDPFYSTAKIMVGAPFRWFTQYGLTGSATKCKKCRIGARLAVSDAAHFDSVKLVLTDGTNYNATTLTVSATMTDYWSAIIDVSGWGTTNVLYASVIADGDDGESAETLVYFDLEYIEVELWGF